MEPGIMVTGQGSPGQRFADFGCKFRQPPMTRTSLAPTGIIILLRHACSTPPPKLLEGMLRPSSYGDI